MMVSNFVGVCTGRSASFSPRNGERFFASEDHRINTGKPQNTSIVSLNRRQPVGRRKLNYPVAMLEQTAVGLRQ
jgi:hypothetical protein